MLFDINSFLHTSARKASDGPHLQKRLFKALSAILRSSCRPTKRLYIAVDGPAPMAKVQTQRKRRATVSYMIFNLL